MNLKTLCLIFFILVIGNVYGQNKLYDSLIKKLDSVSIKDQMYREQFESVRNEYGAESKEMKEIFKLTEKEDSLNLIVVEEIINNYGWLGKDKIGVEGNSTLFIVIQHSDIEIQEKYLPIMRSAVKINNAKVSDFALLEDRVALRKGREQIYGSQIMWDEKTNAYYVLPIQEPDSVDFRRSSVGLPPLSAYLSNWNMKWDINKYKKDLPFVKKYLHDHQF